MLKKIPNKCTECDSININWSPSLRNNSVCVDGRLKLNDIQCIFVLGCDDCSETLAIIDSEIVAALLNER